MSEELKVISLAEITERAKGTIIEIPDWKPGSVIAVRVKSIDMTPHLLATENLPNLLKTSADGVFHGKTITDSDKKKAVEQAGFENVEKIVPIINAIAREVLVEPKYDDIEKIYPLTLAQKMALFNFATGIS